MGLFNRVSKAPTSGQTATGRRGIFYGWWIAIAGGLGMAMSSGINFHGFGNFIIPLSNEFGWNRTTVSAVFALARMETGMMGPLGGWLVDRLGPRRLMLVGIPLMGLGYLLLSHVNSLPTFILVYVGAIAFGNSIGMSTPMTTAVAHWFHRKRGKAFGLMWSGVGIGGLLVPALGWLIARYGWRDASTMVGIGIIVLGIPIGAVMRHRPESYGYLPDGEPLQETAGQEGKTNSAQPDDPGFTAKEALRTSSFWFLSFSIAARSVVTSGVGLHLVPFFIGMEVSPVMAAVLAGSVGVMSIPGRFGLSALSDFIDRRYTMAASLALMTVALVFMSQVGSIVAIVPFLMVYAITQGSIAVIPHAMVADYFGRRSYATIQGFRSTIQMLGVIAGPIFSGFIYDVTGSYEIAFLSFGGATIISMFLVVLARPPKQRASAGV